MLLTKPDAMKAVNKKYTEKLIPQEQKKEPDGRGGQKIVGWEPRAPSMGEIRKISPRTEAVSGAISSVLTRNFAIRYRTDIKKGWRILHESRTYSVEDCFSYGHETTILVCREVVK